ncbi:hypothetical protein BJF78_05415 [Pseudonocardia sp. CNS-139]|nr:hypothetical protein BJF78_05415 [Pseudonocardia sp. CNS-139]
MGPAGQGAELGDGVLAEAGAQVGRVGSRASGRWTDGPCASQAVHSARRSARSAAARSPAGVSVRPSAASSPCRRSPALVSRSPGPVTGAAGSASTASRRTARRRAASRRVRHSTPRPGANISAATATANPVSTTTGPVGSSPRVAVSAPATPTSAPTTPASSSTRGKRSASWRAVTVGTTSIATIRIAPTIRTPITTATTSSAVITVSRTRTGSPIAPA